MQVRGIVASLLLFVVTGPAPAQDAWNQFYWNPAPLDGDIILPLRCGGSMAFRRVDTTVPNNWLADKQLQIGNANIRGQEHSESIVSESIVGGLTRSSPAERYYLVGKYEVTQDQYATLMGTTCPEPTDAGSVPAQGMSWLDAQTFNARYTAWLVKNAQAALEDAAGPEAFARLPTEEEWEFAARGGLSVPEAVLRQKLFPMDGPLEDYVWFAGFQSCDGAIQPVGLLKPNPLGLFDVLGNVQEFTSDLYRMRTRNRQHGQVGGVTARGGSCLTSEARVRSAERDEVRLVDPATGEPAGKDFTGFRVVFGATILSGQSRIVAINDNWQELGDARISINPDDDPAAVLTQIADMTSDTAVRDALERVSTLFETEMERRNITESRSAQSVAQAGVLAVRSYILNLDELNRMGRIVAQRRDNAALQAAFERMGERLVISEDMLLSGIVHAAEDFSETTFTEAARVVAAENELRQRGMSARTRKSSDDMLSLFVDFVRIYRAESDTDPVVFKAALEAYYQSLLNP